MRRPRESNRILEGRGAYLGGHPREPKPAVDGRFVMTETGIFVENMDMEPWRRAAVPWSDIASLSLEPYSEAKSKIPWVLLFGLFGLGASDRRDGTLITVVLRDGASVSYLAEGRFITFRANVLPIFERLGVRVTEPPSVSAPALSIADELTKLAHLRDSGVLTDDEFNAQKAKLLGQGGG